MSTTITVTDLNKFYESGELKFTSIASATNYAELEADVSAARDPIFIAVDLIACSAADFSLEFPAGDYNVGGKDLTMELKTAKFNVIPITSLESKNYNGKVKFKICTTASDVLSNIHPKIAVMTFAPVVNH